VTNAAYIEQPRTVCLLYLTCNRLAYAKLSLPRLLEDSTEDFELVVWDNGSSDGTADFLRGVRDRRIQELALRPTNEGQAPAIQLTWSQTKAALCGKVDDDCLVSPGWTKVLSAAHEEIPQLGGVGCWHFMAEDFDADLARMKLRTFGRHQIVVHPHIGGTGFLTKRADYSRFGPIDPRYLLSDYWVRLAAQGRVNGWYFPLVLQEHMDDPRSAHCSLPETFEGAGRSWMIREKGFRDRAEYEDWIRADAKAILAAPTHLTPVARLRELKARLTRGARRTLGRLA
jgi:glycosyltransferase involved in cell wall biosynthesis